MTTAQNQSPNTLQTNDSGNVILVANGPRAVPLIITIIMFLFISSEITFFYIMHATNLITTAIKLFWLGLASGLIVFFVLATYPTQLTVDDNGISIRRFGVTRKMAWSDMQKLSLEPFRVQGQATKTLITIRSSRRNLMWTDFPEIDQTALANYLQKRLRQALGGQKIDIKDFRPKTKQQFKRQRLAILIAFALIAAVRIGITFLKFHHIH